MTSDAMPDPNAESASTGPSDTVPVTTTAEASKTPDTLTRFLAFLIDGIMVGLVGLVPFIGGLAGIAYVLFRDGLDIEFMRHRSLGKKLMKLDVMRLDGAPMDPLTSARRNWPLAFGSLTQLLIYIPVIGWILIPFVLVAGLVFVIVEIVKVLTATDGRRWGDGLAGTRVIVSGE
jgi:uncharacterized protein involved in cysteine biosynthesis